MNGVKSDTRQPDTAMRYRFGFTFIQFLIAKVILLLKFRGTPCFHFNRQLFLTGGGIFVHSSVVVM